MRSSLKRLDSLRDRSTEWPFSFRQSAIWLYRWMDRCMACVLCCGSAWRILCYSIVCYSRDSIFSNVTCCSLLQGTVLKTGNGSVLGWRMWLYWDKELWSHFQHSELGAVFSVGYSYVFVCHIWLTVTQSFAQNGFDPPPRPFLCGVCTFSSWNLEVSSVGQKTHQSECKWLC